MAVLRTTAALLLAGWTGATLPAAANDDSLAQAKALYASADYDEALAVLDRLQNDAPSADTTIAEYRVYCLLALNRRDEAKKTIEGILKTNPLFVPSEDQASPRVRSVFRDVRRQSLPQIAVERYAMAKASFERKDPQAGEQFDGVLKLLDDPDLKDVSALRDLLTVVTAFRDLATAMTQMPGPAVARPADKTSAPADASEPQSVADILHIYTSADADVAPPIPIQQSQRTPQWIPPRSEATKEFHGTLELLIDETGSVTSAAMRASVHPAYNEMLMRAARDWKFRPARRQGSPVRYLKIVEIHLKPVGE